MIRVIAPTPGKHNNSGSNTSKPVLHKRHRQHTSDRNRTSATSRQLKPSKRKATLTLVKQSMVPPLRCLTCFRLTCMKDLLFSTAPIFLACLAVMQKYTEALTLCPGWSGEDAVALLFQLLDIVISMQLALQSFWSTGLCAKRRRKPGAWCSRMLKRHWPWTHTCSRSAAALLSLLLIAHQAKQAQVPA